MGAGVMNSLYVILLRWNVSLVKYNGSTYVTDKSGDTNKIDKFANIYINNALTKYSINELPYTDQKFGWM